MSFEQFICRLAAWKSWLVYRRITKHMRFWSMSVGAASLLVEAAHSNPSAAHPCPTPPCSTMKECEAKADWVVEGTIDAIADGAVHRECETGPPPPYGPFCGSVQEAPSLLLSKAIVRRGNLQVIGGKLNIKRMASCYSDLLGGNPPGFSRTTGLSSDFNIKSIGRRFRFYGFSSQDRAFVSPGFFVTEPIDPTTASSQ